MALVVLEEEGEDEAGRMEAETSVRACKQPAPSCPAVTVETPLEPAEMRAWAASTVMPGGGSTTS